MNCDAEKLTAEVVCYDVSTSAVRVTPLANDRKLPVNKVTERCRLAVNLRVTNM